MTENRIPHLRRAPTSAAIGLLVLLPGLLQAQVGARGFLALSESFYRSGDLTVAAFAPVVSSARRSVVQILLDGRPAALGAVVDTNGFAITKASEIKEGRLTARLFDGRTIEVAEVASDPRNDIALVRLQATGLIPVVWNDAPVSLGQWLVTPGTGTEPEAVGVLSASTRKLHKRAIIGVILDLEAPNARIAEVQPEYGAARAGLRSGDVILTVNSTPVKDSEELKDTLRDFREGQIIELRIARDDEEFNVSVEMKPETALVNTLRGRGQGRGTRSGRFAGEVSQRAEDFEMAMQHDAVLQPEQCGGPVLNLDGKAIGLNIARAGRIASYALPASLVNRIIAELKDRSTETQNGDRGKGG
jgi:serine protease Do